LDEKKVAISTKNIAISSNIKQGHPRKWYGTLKVQEVAENEKHILLLL
jgi:hypothetical protein